MPGKSDTRAKPVKASSNLLHLFVGIRVVFDFLYSFRITVRPSSTKALISWHFAFLLEFRLLCFPFHLSLMVGGVNLLYRVRIISLSPPFVLNRS